MFLYCTDTTCVQNPRIGVAGTEKKKKKTSMERLGRRKENGQGSYYKGGNGLCLYACIRMYGRMYVWDTRECMWDHLRIVILPLPALFLRETNFMKIRKGNVDLA